MTVVKCLLSSHAFLYGVIFFKIVNPSIIAKITVVALLEIQNMEVEEMRQEVDENLR